VAIFFNEREDHLIDLLPAIELGERSGGFGCRIEDAAAAIPVEYCARGFSVHGVRSSLRFRVCWIRIVMLEKYSR